ncbi:uncharacterized protein LOC119072591 [Bradysia coprophila]|uniref:uncharacterized protein LOC119072591 n=1 Tax=Bradysia coprophila TaxID=38358 RepID=UPI00187DBACC|nr:uncharacterized protein LOC119072591 [Bradysia coprophila]XP_037033741.1 uncharacterized protein LOC119072591 [Bradysia coprophila]
MNVHSLSPLVFLGTVILTLNWSVHASQCPLKFEGFGVFLGSNDHLGRSKPGTEAKVVQIVYESLGIRLFRTSYEQQFSPAIDKYEIKCNDPYTCSWINIHEAVSSYPDVKVFASIWSPPHYMKDEFFHLLPEYETAFLHYIRNVTAMVKGDFNIDIEKVSPVNEPENVFAPWDHTNMSPMQLCRIIRNFNDPLISVCPENAWFSVTTAYYNILGCVKPCGIKATHAYALNTDFTSPNFKLGYYDLVSYNYRGTTGPMWMTEVSSTYLDSDTTQMNEALDLAINIVNFVGVTCIQRYYFWYAYTKGHSGESLIWGNEEGDLFLPKKFFVYKLFVSASNTTSHGPVDVSGCEAKSFPCIQFDKVDRVLVNKESSERTLEVNECSSLCCVTESDDFICFDNTERLPPRAVCHCALNVLS